MNFLVSTNESNLRSRTASIGPEGLRPVDHATGQGRAMKRESVGTISARETGEHIKRVVVDSNVVLEAFGNGERCFYRH